MIRDPELVARAQHAAAHLESAWEQWRSLQGLGDTPTESVVGYVGYALNEPWGQPRAVIGFSAEEAERLADYLERSSAGYIRAGRRQAVTAVPQQSSEPSPHELAAQPQPDAVAVTSQLSCSQHWHSFLPGRSVTLRGQEPIKSGPVKNVWARDGQAPARAQTQP